MLRCVRASAGMAPDSLIASVVRAARSRSDVLTDSPLDALSPGQRATSALAFALDWDVASIAEERRTTQARVRRDVGAALDAQSEAEWRALFAESRWWLP